MYVYFLFHWLGGENCFYFLYIKDDRLQKNLKKRNVNDGTIVFLMYLLIVFLIKKETLAQMFPVNFANFLRTLF